MFSARDIFKLPKIIPNSQEKKPRIKKQLQPTHLSQSVQTQVLALSIYDARLCLFNAGSQDQGLSGI
jgi:hypothetical protein